MKGWKNDNDPWVPLKENDGRLVGASTFGSCHSHSAGLSTPTTTAPIPNHPTSNAKEVDEKTALLRMMKPPDDPLHNMIDSERYIQTLERKLERLKKKKENPSSRDIINSLALFHEDQMRNFVNSDSLSADDTMDSDRNLTPSYMKRKLFPELQAINTTEVAGLVKEDFVEKLFEELSMKNDVNASEPGLEKHEESENNLVDECQIEGEKVESNIENSC